MKIIDLLNKIANGEEVPKIIKYDLQTYYFRNYDYKKCDIEKNLIDENSSFIEDKFDFYKINDEVEIIEEEKKIPEKLPKSVTDNAGSSKDMRLIAITLNEIIDYLKSKED